MIFIVLFFVILVTIILIGRKIALRIVKTFNLDNNRTSTENVFNEVMDYLNNNKKRNDKNN